jgi:hypothetical protein
MESAKIKHFAFLRLENDANVTGDGDVSAVLFYTKHYEVEKRSSEKKDLHKRHWSVRPPALPTHPNAAVLNSIPVEMERKELRPHQSFTFYFNVKTNGA